MSSFESLYHLTSTQPVFLFWFFFSRMMIYSVVECLWLSWCNMYEQRLLFKDVWSTFLSLFVKYPYMCKHSVYRPSFSCAAQHCSPRRKAPHYITLLMLLGVSWASNLREFLSNLSVKKRSAGIIGVLA